MAGNKVLSGRASISGHSIPLLQNSSTTRNNTVNDDDEHELQKPSQNCWIVA
jgi:hypothetical protein